MGWERKGKFTFFEGSGKVMMSANGLASKISFLLVVLLEKYALKLYPQFTLCRVNPYLSVVPRPSMDLLMCVCGVQLVA